MEKINTSEALDSFRNFFCRFAGRLLIVYLSLKGYNIEIRGKENITSKGAFIYGSNHLSYADPALLWATVAGDIRFWMKTDITGLLPLDFLIINLFRPLFGVLTIERKKKRLRQINDLVKISREILCKNHGIGIFPEGTRSKKGYLIEPQPGLPFLAHSTKTPVIPVSIQGTRGVMNPFWGWKPGKRRVIIVSIGKPFSIERIGKANKESEWEDQIMMRIAEMLPREMRGRFGVEETAA